MLTKGELERAIRPFTDGLEIVVHHNQQRRRYVVLGWCYELDGDGYGQLVLRIGDPYPTGATTNDGKRPLPRPDHEGP